MAQLPSPMTYGGPDVRFRVQSGYFIPRLGTSAYDPERTMGLAGIPTNDP